MARNVNRFTKELVDYMNANLAGAEHSKIKKAADTGQTLARGRAITIELVTPPTLKLSDDGTTVGPVFYAEELMEEFPNATIAAVGESVNVRVNENYDHFLEMSKRQLELMNKRITDFEPDELIVSAVPLVLADDSSFTGPPDDPLIAQVREDLHLHLMIKGRIYQQNDETAYFSPIFQKDKPARKKHWNAAIANSLRNGQYMLEIMKAMPNFGRIRDVKGFYGYFYLLSPKETFEHIAKSSDADKIYILPNDICGCTYMLAWDDMEADMGKEIVDNMSNALINGAKANCTVLPLYELDCKDFTVKEAKDVLGRKLPEFTPNKNNQGGYES